MDYQVDTKPTGHRPALKAVETSPDNVNTDYLDFSTSDNHALELVADGGRRIDLSPFTAIDLRINVTTANSLDWILEHSTLEDSTLREISSGQVPANGDELAYRGRVPPGYIALDVSGKTGLEVELRAYRHGLPGDALGSDSVVVEGLDYDATGVSYGGSGAYESVTIGELSAIQDSSDWIDVRDFIRASIAVNPNSESMDVEVQYKFSDGDAGQQLTETTNISSGTRSEILTDEDIEGYGYLRIRQKDNAGDGGGGIDVRGVLK